MATATTRSLPARALGARGQATVELALCLPVVLALVGVLVEVGGLAGEQVRLWHAAREAARAAAVEADTDAVRAAARRAGLEPVDAKVDPPPSERRSGEPVTVSLAYRHRGRVPVLRALFDGAILRATASMRIESP